jgi:hypothetical protein
MCSALRRMVPAAHGFIDTKPATQTSTAFHHCKPLLLRILMLSSPLKSKGNQSGAGYAQDTS